MAGYPEILGAMEGCGADYAWMGLGAAGVHGATLVSYDFDFFVRPDPVHLERAREAFRKLGMMDSMAHVIAANLIAAGVTASFGDPYGGPVVDLMTEISGPSFEQVWRDSVQLEAGGARVRVASLRHILQSKMAADRQKDRDAIKRLRLDFPGLVNELEKESGK